MLDTPTRNDLVARAILAPSSHNTQPWIFVAEEDAIALHADRTRALPVNDPHDRELTISCGCALLNLRAAAADKGEAVTVDPLPDGEAADTLARIRFAGEVEAALRPIARGIEERRTCRKRFKDLPVPAEIVAALQDAAQVEGAELRPVEEVDQRFALADLVMKGDLAQWDDPHWRRELAAWMHPRRKGDGLSLPGLAVPVAQAIVRSFDMGGGVGAKDRELVEHSPFLAVLATPGDTPGDWLAAGQALERVLLTGAMHGIQASYLNQPVQVAALRNDLRALSGVSGQPQIVLRMGYPDGALPAAPRRPAEDAMSDAR